jgi:hypothetical protein
MYTLLFHFHAKEEMQIVKIFHFKFLKKITFVVHENEIINIDNNEKKIISNLLNIHAKVCITPHKLNVF